MRERSEHRARDVRCTRSLAEQYSDRSGSVRRTDHPHTALHRLDLLADIDLDAFRRAHAERAAHAFEAYDLLVEAMEARLTDIEKAATAALEDRTPARPILAVAICVACGAHDVVRASRSWDLDRAMRRTNASERDLLNVVALLAEAWAEVAEAPPSIDALATEEIIELLDLVGQDVDHDSVRERYAGQPRGGSTVRTFSYRRGD